MTDDTPLNADDELHDAIYGIAELNIKNIESCEMMYAVKPFRLIRFIKKHELQARIDELEATSYTEQSSTAKGEIRPGVGFNLISNRLAELKQELEKL